MFMTFGLEMKKKTKQNKYRFFEMYIKKHSTSTHVQAGLVSYAKVVKNEPLIAEIHFEHAEMKRTVTCCKIRRDYKCAVQRHWLINNHLI